MEPPSAQSEPAEPLNIAGRPPDGTVRHALRLLGHVRLYVALIALVIRLSALLGIVLVWAMLASDRVGFSHGASLQHWALLVLATMLAVQLLLPDSRHPIVRGLLAAAGVIVSGLLISYIDSLLIANPHESYVLNQSPAARAGLPGMLLSCAAAAAGIIAIVVIERLRRKVANLQGQFDAILTLLPQADVPGDRAALGRVLARAESTAARTILSVQAAAALMALLPLTLLGYSYVEYVRQSAASAKLILLQDAIVWLIAGIMVGALLATATLRNRTLPAAVIGSLFVCGGIGAGAFCSSVTSASSHLRDLGHWFLTSLIACSGAIPSLLLVRWALMWQMRRLLPLPVQRLLLPDTSLPTDDTVSHFAPSLHCEACGYSLQGLPETVCTACTTASHRCPECGHVQPAATRYARLLRRMHRQHLIIRVQDVALRIGIAVLVLVSAYAFGTDLRRIDLTQTFLMFTTACVLIGMLRYVALRLRPVLLVSLLCGALPYLCVVAGAMLTPYAVPVTGVRAIGGTMQLKAPEFTFRPTITLASLGWISAAVLLSMAFPWLWRAWLTLLLGRDQATNVHRWETSRVYRRTPAAGIVTACQQSLFREIPMTCDHCGQASLPPAPRMCTQCGCHTVTCAACASHTPISATRVGLEALLYRARMMALASIALMATGFAVAMLLQLALHGQEVSRIGLVFQQRLYMPNEFAIGLLLAALGGTIASLLFIRRRTIIVAVFVCAFWQGTMHILSRQIDTPAFTVFYCCEAAAAFVAALLARRLFSLASRMLLPRGIGQPLMAWLTGRLTLDEAASELPQ